MATKKKKMHEKTVIAVGYTYRGTTIFQGEDGSAFLLNVSGSVKQFADDDAAERFIDEQIAQLESAYSKEAVVLNE